MRIVVTGATGFIGGRLTARLLAEGHTVTALVRRAEAKAPAGVECLAGALDDMEFLRQALAGAAAVVHVAGQTKAFTARGFFHVNEELTAALAEGVRRFAPVGAPFLHVSSQAAVGPSNEPPGLIEDDQPAPVSRYGLSKLLGERAVQTLTPQRPVAVARPAMVYGPGDMAFVPLYRCMARGVLLTSGPVGQRFSIVHVDDLVDGLVLALDALRGGWGGDVLHFAGPESFSWEEYAAAFGQALERRVRVLRVPGWALLAAALGNTLCAALGLPTSHLTLDKRREALAPGWLLSCAHTREALGWTPRRGLALGARESVAWCREKGLLPGCLNRHQPIIPGQNHD
ncbi:MAG: NAD-dependent epimerase/dehydratase family protein [Humidesulfovibrio sp.]|nr:NAD-dependent epimerase/dehydratase family protein [Humidesulfovibrio sp.]